MEDSLNLNLYLRSDPDLYIWKDRTSYLRYLLKIIFTTLRKLLSKTENNKCWQRCGEIGIFVHHWWEYNMMQTLQKIVSRFLKKLKIELPHNTAIELLGVYPKNWKQELEQIFVHPYSEQHYSQKPKDGSHSNVNKQNVYMYSGILFSLKKKEILRYATIWMNLRKTAVSETSQSQGQIFIWYLESTYMRYW